MCSATGSAVRIVSTRRASSSIVVANVVTASRAPVSPQPAIYGIDSPPTSSPTLAAATNVAASTITSARSRPYQV